jgi:hypothetical protein
MPGRVSNVDRMVAATPVLTVRNEARDMLVPAANAVLVAQ